jgi:hypothetical protein
MTDDSLRKQTDAVLEASQSLAKASQHQFQAVEKSRTRALELALISKKMLATARLLQQKLSN